MSHFMLDFLGMVFGHNLLGMVNYTVEWFLYDPLKRTAFVLAGNLLED